MSVLKTLASIVCMCNLLVILLSNMTPRYFTQMSWVELSWVELISWPTVSRAIRLGVGHPFGSHDQIFLFAYFCRTIALLFVLGRRLWREDGSVIYSAMTIALVIQLQHRRCKNYLPLSRVVRSQEEGVSRDLFPSNSYSTVATYVLGSGSPSHNICTRALTLLWTWRWRWNVFPKLGQHYSNSGGTDTRI
jgi:hypothetical protein